MPKKIDIDALASRILRGDLGKLSQAELDAVLSWISGSEKLGASELIRRVGVPRERPDVMHEVYVQLDAMLFVDGRLDRRRAGVDARVDDKLRRSRFRRLMTAFHPDRHPDSADWLTPRSQAVLDAYRAFRAGDEDQPEAPTPARPARRAARGGRWPVERSSARLTPQRAGPLTRARMRLRNTDNLQGKILAALAVVAFVPVIWVYFSYKPYRDRLAPAPAPAEVSRAESPAERPLTMHPPRPDALVEPAARAAESVAASAAAPEPEATVANVPDMPDEIDVHGGQSERRAESAPTSESEAAAKPIDLDPLIEQAAEALDQVLAYNAPEPAPNTEHGTPNTAQPPQAPEPSANTAPPESPTRTSDNGQRTTVPEPKPQADTPSETSNPPESPTRTSDNGPRTTVPEPKPQADTPSETSNPPESPTRTSDHGPQTTIPEPAPQAKTPSEATAPSESPTRNTEHGTPNTAQPPQADTPSETSNPSESPTRNTEPRTPNTIEQEQPQAEAPPATPEPNRKPPIKQRIQHLLDTYSLQFAVGNLDGIMALLAAEPRENRNRGRDWFRESYSQLFEQSAARRIDIEVLDVEPRGEDWRVAARFELSVNYPGRRGATAEQLVEYSIVEDDEGRLRIRAIDY